MAKRNLDETRTQPLTLAALSKYGVLDDFSPPESFIKPDGQWRNMYRIWLVSRNDSGFLSIERKPDPGGSILNTQVSVLQAAGTVYQTRVELHCANDALSTPYSWKIESEIADSNLRPIDSTKVKEIATVKGDRILATTDNETFERRMPGPFTCNWALFDAVQRLPGRDMANLEFGLLEDLDLPKERQRLSYWQSTELVVGQNTLQLTGYQQIGNGILPYQYWVDDYHRLLFVISGIRAYIFDPNAQKSLEQRLQNLARRKQ